MQVISWRRNLAMLWFSQLMVMSGYDALSPFVPLFMKDKLGITSPAELAYYISWYAIASFVGYGIANPIWGWLGDRYGMKSMLLRGTFLTSVFWIWMAYSTSPEMMVALRFVTAFLAGTTAASQIMLARTVPLERQGYAQGVLISAIWAGSILGNVVGGFMIHYFSFYLAFWCCGLMYIAGGVFALFTQDSGNRAQVSNSSRRGFHLPMLPHATWMIILMFLLMGIMRRLDLPYTSLRVEALVAQGTAAYWTGIVSAFVGGGAILSGLLLGRYVDRYPASRLLTPMIVCTVILSVLQGICGHLWVYAISRGLLFFIVGMLQPTLQKLLSSVTSQDKRGLAFGLSTTFMAIGGCIASLLGGFFMGRYGVSAVYWATAGITLICWPLLRKGIGRIEWETRKDMKRTA